MPFLPLGRRRPLSHLLVLLTLGLGACAHKATPPPAVASAPVAARPASAPSAVKIGVCTGFDGLAKAKAAGFDYGELRVRDFARMSDESFAKALVRKQEAGLPTPVANSFLPDEIKVVGSAADPAAQMAYVEKAFSRAETLGIGVIVFGSGKARAVPEGVSHDEAFAQLVDFAKRIAPVAQQHHVVVAVEPLRHQECNIINSASEGLAWVKAVEHPNFQLMVDFYHLASEKEDPGIISQAGPHVRHFHIANPNGRVFPMAADEFDYRGFFANVAQLRRIGFSGGISVEANTKDFAADAPKAVAFLRSQVDAPL